MLKEAYYEPRCTCLDNFGKIVSDNFGKFSAEDHLFDFALIMHLLFQFDKVFQDVLQVRMAKHYLQIIIDALFLLNLPEHLVHCIGIFDFTKFDAGGKHLRKHWLFGDVF